jgi:hypothetical protein
VCAHSGCPVAVIPRATPGRPARYCPEHVGGAASVARSRARRKTGAARPQCCQDAGRSGGRLSCPQHKQGVDWFNVGPGAPFDDYAGAELPRPKRRGEQRELPERGTWHVDGTVSLWEQPMSERHSWGTLAGAPLQVLGGSDPLAADRWMRAQGLSWDVEPRVEERLAA